MATTLNTIPAEEGDTLLPKKPQASLKFQAHMGAANASTKAKKIIRAVVAVRPRFKTQRSLRARSADLDK